jgi:type IX secretion system substrate protein/copper type II ascorbate-dependent monooxygenase-like protein
MKKLCSLVSLLAICATAFSQTTYQTVYGILQSNCTTSGCHTTGNPQGIDLSGTQSQVYANLVGVAPANSTAAAAGMKLVDPGQPRNSFLFSKLHAGLEANLTLTAGEGADMDSSHLTLTQREMVRQWIIFGARDTGTFVSVSLIDSFYTNQGGIPYDSLRVQAPAAPAAGEGYQLHFGPIFMMPGVEFEYNNKYYLGNNATIDAYRMQTVENAEAHHFAIYRFFPLADTLLPPGLSRVNGLSDEALLYYNANVVAQWPKSKDVTYPQGLAEVWAPGSVLDLDYHLINYQPYMLAAESYLNVYYNPHSTATIAIQTYPVRYGGDNVDALTIPPGDTTFTMVQGGAGQNLPSYADSTFYWNIVSLQAHTHKIGTGFNVWTRKSNGAKDSLIYDGRYDPSYTFNTGTYSWNDAPYRQFTEPYPVYMANGMIHEATYHNPTNDTVNFGLLTTNEMFVTFILYYESELPYNSIHDVPFTDNNIKMYPNPASDVEYIRLDAGLQMSGTEIQFFDELGQKVLDQTGITTHVFSTNMSKLTNGCYVYRLINNGENVGTGKIVVQH